MNLSSWDLLASSDIRLSYTAGVPIGNLVSASALPAQIEAVILSTDHEPSICHLELTLIFREFLGQRAARDALDSLLETHVSSLCAAIGTPLLGLHEDECIAAVAVALPQLQLLPRDMWPHGGAGISSASRDGFSGIGPPASWAPALNPDGADDASTWEAGAPHLAHGRWTWPHDDAYCRRARTLSFFGVPDASALNVDRVGAIHKWLRAASDSWSLPTPQSPLVPNRQFQLTVTHNFARLAELELQPHMSGWSPPPLRKHVDVSWLQPSTDTAGSASDSGRRAADAANHTAVAPLPAVRLGRQLAGSGYHLSLITNASLVTHANKGCTRWAAIERLPSAAIFDPHQLRRVTRRSSLGGALGAIAMGEALLETPAAEAPQAMALVHGGIGATEKRRHARAAGMVATGLELQSSVPFHLRYAVAIGSGDAHVAIQLPLPMLFLWCANEVAGTATTHMRAGDPNAVADDAGLEGNLMSCPPLKLIGSGWRDACVSPLGAPAHGEWRRVHVIGIDTLLAARVPIGQAEGAPKVVAGTILAFGAATLWLMWMLWRAPTPM